MTPPRPARRPRAVTAMLGATLVAGAVAAVRQRREARGSGGTAGDGPGGRLATWVPSAPRTVAGRGLAAVWSAPLTAVGLAVALAGGRVPRYDAARRCWVATRVGGPSAVALGAVGAAANTIGRVVIVRGAAPSPALLDHEAAHVRQAERLGPLLPVAYAWAGAVHGYARNPFERAARLAARRAADLRTAGGGS